MKAELTIRLFVAIIKCLNDESTRFIGTLKREQKKAFNLLLNAIQDFERTVKVNMDAENIENCEQLQDYLHDLIFDFINDGKKELQIFSSLCRIPKIIYAENILNKYRHSDKELFITVMNQANIFSQIVGSHKYLDTEFEHFCRTLINGETYETN